MEKIMLKFYQVYNNNLSFKSMKFENSSLNFKVNILWDLPLFSQKKRMDPGNIQIKI